MKTKKAYSILLCFFVGVFALKGKDKKQAPDYDEIQKQVKDSTSQFYYPKIFQRYLQNDTTLTLKDYHYLYYGFFFDKGYKLLDISPYTDSARKILNKDEPNQKELEKLVYYETKLLETSPFSLSDLAYLRYAQRNSDDAAGAALTNKKLINLLKTILATGDGKSEKTAWHVISVDHEYSLIRQLGYSFGGDQKLTPNQCDYLSLKKNNDGRKGVYFDVHMIMKKEMDMFKK